MINYKNIAAAIDFYEKRGYKQLEVPWIVSRDATKSTIPVFCKPFETFLGDLVGSGEQSFIQMVLDGKMPRGKFQCVTPCFRDEKELDENHLNYFLKLELIDTRNPLNKNAIEEMLYDAQAFFESIGVDVYSEDVEYHNRRDTDLIHFGSFVELGSYGIREYKGFSWVFGTGCAEPRLSNAQKYEEEK